MPPRAKKRKPQIVRTRSLQRRIERKLHDSNRNYILRRDNWTCAYCGRTAGQLPKGQKLTLDHVVPLSRGGSDTRDNMVAACEACNQKKSHRTPDEWRSEIPLRFCTAKRPLTLQQITKIQEIVFSCGSSAHSF